jgi:hypothetical protein
MAISPHKRGQVSFLIAVILHAQLAVQDDALAPAIASKYHASRRGKGGKEGNLLSYFSHSTSPFHIGYF